MQKSGNCGWSSQRENSRPPRSKPMKKSAKAFIPSQREHSTPPPAKPVPPENQYEHIWNKAVAEAEEGKSEKTSALAEADLLEKSRALAEAAKGLRQSMGCSRCGTRAADTGYLHWKNLGRIDYEHWFVICKNKGLPLSAYRQTDRGCTWICLCYDCFNFRGGWRNYMGRVPPEKRVDGGYSPFSSVGSLDSVGSSLPATGSGSQALPVVEGTQSKAASSWE
jgi:hypothetical protein